MSRKSAERLSSTWWEHNMMLGPTISDDVPCLSFVRCRGTPNEFRRAKGALIGICIHPLLLLSCASLFLTPSINARRRCREMRLPSVESTWIYTSTTDSILLRLLLLCGEDFSTKIFNISIAQGVIFRGYGRSHRHIAICLHPAKQQRPRQLLMVARIH